ncbi:MAG TPA: hypothetical protein VGF88_21960 [Acidobacteriaceae bacterium]|jgi:lysine-N-methylase
MASFACIAIRFGMLKGLLIGVAGFHDEAFAEAHVVQNVQVISKQFEHSRDFLEASYALLAQNKLASVPGLTMLLPN